MSENITYIEDWKKEYPILGNIWNTYDKFDETVDNDPKKNNYISVCSYFIDRSNEEKEKHEEFCKKLVRNLGHYSDNKDFLTYSGNRCLNLNNWIYNSMMKHNIPKSIITECFDEYNGTVTRMKQNPTCLDYEYDKKYAEPMKIIILKIFESNMNIIQNILDGAYDSVNFLLLKYICECVKIYKEMNRKYCPKSDEKSEKSNNTCDMLNIFKEIYKSFLSATQQKNYKIPSLDKDEAQYLAMCPQYNPSLKLTSKANRILPVLGSFKGVEAEDTDDVSSYGGPKDYARDLTSPTEADGVNQVSPMSRTVSTAVGTMAGASSVLALLYKFTPGRKWIHSGFGRRRARIGSNFYEEGASELLYNGLENEDFISYNQRYDIGYSPL